MRPGVLTTAAWILFALLGCTKEEAQSPDASPNEAAARDAAPGEVSETSPPSTPEPK
jgi:hypothetical protein